MRKIFTAFAILVLAISSGCVTTRVKDGKPVSAAKSNTLRSSIAKAFEPAKQSLNRVTKNDVRHEVEPWKWSPAVPVGVSRADLASCNVRTEVLATWLPPTCRTNVRLASYQPETAAKVAFVNGRKIANFADLTRAVNGSVDHQVVQVDFQDHSGNFEAIEIPVPELYRLSQFVEPELATCQYTEESNPWFLIREGDVRCRGTVRVERNRGIGQVVLTISNTSNSQTVVLPAELTATCDGQPLQILTVDQCLDQLYAKTPKQSPLNQTSFAIVSDRVDYLIPAKYRALEKEVDERKSLQNLQPAFATVNSEVYPGSALLGDARALSQFLLRRERIEPNTGEVNGWLILSSPILRTGDSITLHIDLGYGPREIVVRLP